MCIITYFNSKHYTHPLAVWGRGKAARGTIAVAANLALVVASTPAAVEPPLSAAVVVALVAATPAVLRSGARGALVEVLVELVILVDPPPRNDGDAALLVARSRGRFGSWW